MMYKAELDKIPMRVYIDVVLGKFEGEFECSLDEAEIRLKQAYLTIVGGRKVTAEIARQSARLDAEITVQCLGSAKSLLAMGRKDLAEPVMRNLGYDILSLGSAQAKAKIDNIIRMTALRKAREESKKPAESEDNTKITEDTFVRERVAMMSHYKMHIDINVLSAAEYAHLLKRMCDELERDAQAMKRRMQKQ